MESKTAEAPHGRPPVDQPNFSFFILLDQYIAIQNLLMVRMQEINYQQVRLLMPGGQVNYYSKRAGKSELSSQEMLVLAAELEMPAASSVIQELISCRNKLHQSLTDTGPAMIRDVSLDTQTTRHLIRLRLKSADRWKNADLVVVLEALKAIHGKVTGLLNLPDAYKTGSFPE